MVDLHTHTKYSTDASGEIPVYLKEAENAELSMISITDHNCSRAYEELKNPDIRKIFSGMIVTGVELFTRVLNYPIEILGYNIDPVKMQKLIESTYMNEVDRCKLELKRLYEKCIEAGLKLPNDFVDGYDGTEYGSKYLHKFITKDEKNKKYFSAASWENNNVFYREYMSNPNTKFYVDMNDVLPDFEVVSGIVRQAGGLVFLPHLYEYKENSEIILNYILEHYEIDGIECYYKNFTEEQSEYLQGICKERNLFMSGGSDYHGAKKPGISIGKGLGNLCVPDGIADKWAKRFA